MYHEGELALQRRLGVTASAERIAGMMRREIPPAAHAFIDDGHFVAIAVRDADGFPAVRLGDRPRTVRVAGDCAVELDVAATSGSEADPHVRSGDPAGLLLIDFATRRRMRLNGRIALPAGGLPVVVADAVYSNCPKYIQQRRRTEAPRWPASEAAIKDELDAESAAVIRRADTFFIASAHPEAGADVNHRGGQPGFVDVLDSRRLRWPDYPGNHMYQTLGNLMVDARVGLAFVDFAGGGACFARARAEITFAPHEGGERIRFIDVVVERVWSFASLPLARYDLVAPSPHNPQLVVG